ncbi:hypothetical protein [Rubritalea sp.]|uniref:hypothetical protein n=1 Tax=Rubritalea sp. TaxID=2109375 RepID=UPI003241DABF
MKRLAIIGGVSFIVVGSTLWFSRHAIANAVIDDALVKVAAKANKVGVELVDLNSGEIEIPTPFDAQVQNLTTDFDIGVRNKDKIRSRFESAKGGFNMINNW